MASAFRGQPNRPLITKKLALKAGPPSAGTPKRRITVLDGLSIRMVGRVGLEPTTR